MADTTIIGYVPVDRAGDTMDGDLILNGDPTTPNQAANKNYVDGIVANIPYVPPTPTESAGFEFLEATNNGTDKVTLKSPENITTGDYEVTLPPDNGGGNNSFLTYTGNNELSFLSYPTGAENVLLDSSDVPYFAVMLAGDATSQSMMSQGSIMTPRSGAAGAPFTSGRFSFNEGTGGTGSTTGNNLFNDVLYCFPFYLMHNDYDQLRVNIHTADVSGTASLELNLFNPFWRYNSDDKFLGAAIMSTVTETNISVTGELEFNFAAPVEISGWVWAVFRSFNIGTALVLGNSANLYPERLQNIIVTPQSTDAKVPAFGYIITGQTSMPVNGATLSPTGTEGSGVGLAIRGA